ncbi:MAG: hypothetical protein ACP59X_03575 [Solidesulfovibrio sp. DCME]|uniref:hypothetical protein n=1 Tax=Solidesulfovibrio sp. DCME TaxID=3447380 RepID=UPI003D121CB1
MFAVYCEKPNEAEPLRALEVGQRPEPEIPEGWVRVRVTHASLNRHDIFTLRGITGQDTPIPFPMILGNDAVARHGLAPQIARVLPMERAREGFAAMWEGRLGGKIVLTRSCGVP